MAKNNNTKKNNSYFKEMKQELKKVTWPTPKETINNTIVVIAFVLIIGILVFVLDFCFDNLNKYGIAKMQEKVQSVVKSTDEVEDAQENSENNTENNENSSENGENKELEYEAIPQEDENNNQNVTENTELPQENETTN